MLLDIEALRFLGRLWEPILLASIALVVGTSFLYFIGIGIYRLWFHPLSKYPGPFLARITSAYGGYHAYKGDLHVDMWRCHEKYGEIVRYSPNRLLVNTSSGLRDIQSFSAQIRKSPAYKALVHRAPNILTTIDKKEHGKKRRIISQGFSTSASKTYEPRILTHINKFCDLVNKASFDDSVDGKQTKWSKPMVMSDWTGYLAFDVMTDVIFGEHYNLLERESNRYILPCIEKSAVRTGTMCQWPRLRWDNQFGSLGKKLHRAMFAEAIRNRNVFIQFVNRLMQARMSATPMERPDLFTFMLNAKDPDGGAGLGANELAAESTSLTIAGSDTTATALSSTIFYLARNPAAYSLAVAEVRAAFPTASDVRLCQTLNSCIYLRACIDEAMRLSPPIGSALWREITDSSCSIGGIQLPAGVEIGTCIYSIHHNPEYYPEPFAYKPERWIVSETTGVTREAVDVALSAYNPFSLGPRSCVGKPLALNELMLTMAMVLINFDFRSPQGVLRKIGEGRAGAEWGRHRPNEYQLKDFVTAVKHGPVVEFKKRDV